MAAEVRDLNADKLFKIAKLNLRGRAKEWFKRLQLAPADWAKLRTLIVQKYGNVDVDDIRMKFNAIKQEPKERVQKYFERFDKLFQRGRVQDVEQRRRFLARLRPEIRKLCVVRTFTNIEELVGAAIKLERVLGELGETPFEPLKEEQEEGVAKTIMEEQVVALNNTFVSFFKRNVPNPIASSSSTMFSECQICKGGDHIATACLRLNEPRLKCAKCGMSHRTENCGMKCSFCSGLGHLEDRCWKKPKDGKSHFGVANFLEVLLNDGEATMQQLNKLCANENIFSHPRAPRRRMPVEVATRGAVPSPEVAKGVTIHQGLGVDEKVSSTTVQDLPAYEASIDTDKTTENLEAVVGHGIAPSLMKHQETRTTRMAISNAILVGKVGKSAQNTNGVLGSTVEGMNEQLKEKLDNVEGLEVKCLTGEEPGILEEERSPKLRLFLNTLASSKGPYLTDDVFDISDVGEELVAYDMVSEGNLDMSEDDRVVIHMLPRISTEPAAMGVSSYSDNVMRGEHQADHDYLGLGNCGRTEVVQRPRENILHKQEEDKADKIATDILPILEIITAPTLMDKNVFPSEETKVETIEKEVNPLAWKVYMEAYPVDILGDEENLNCLDELHTTETTDMLVRTADIPEGLTPAVNLEVLVEDRFEIKVDDQLLRSTPEQTYFSVVESNDSTVFMENLDNPHEFPVINLEKEEDESSAHEAIDGPAWHAPVTQENSVALAKLVAHDCVVRDVNPGKEVEESECDQDSVSQGGSCITDALLSPLLNPLEGSTM
jgi:hypothetical protein